MVTSRGILTVHRSNRVERLVDALAARIGRAPTDAAGRPDPFAVERVVIHSRGMESWLSAKLAERLGVCANVEFLFPKRAILDAFGGDRPLGVRDDDPWQPDRLYFAILAALPALLDEPAFTPLRRYLADDRALRTPKSHRLVRRVADLFDRYLTYRPEMIHAWEHGRDRSDDDWQSRLWLALQERIAAPHVVDRTAQFLADEDTRDDDEGCGRISLFCISMLPPLYVQIFAAWSRRVDVDMYLLCPSREYWGDIASRREQLRAARGLDPEELAAQHFTEGHPLLASLGRLGRDFQVTLEQFADYHDPDDDLFESPTGGPDDASLLRTLQHDILDLSNPRDHARRAVVPDDDSIEVHSCHGPMRQVEVLKDRLLDLFQRDPDLEPRDVVVMTPDIDVYAPLIEAAFSDERDDPRHIPYRIADRSLRRESPVAEAFLRVLDLAGSRAGATEVFDLLSLPVIRQRFGIAVDELDTIADWIRETGVRWGIDEDHRHAHQQPAERQNTWRFGVDRLLLGAAMHGDGHSLFEGVLPFEGAEGSGAELAGRFARFVDELFASLYDLAGDARPLDAWRDAGGALIQRLFHDDDAGAWERDGLREILSDLATQAGEAGFDEPIELDVLRDLLQSRLDQATGSARFFAGGLTVCAMVPMRTVPFRVVCLLGLDDGAFPRSEARLGFDKIASRPMIGDRTRRDEDRYLVLEALLSARDRLIITYTGRSIQTNEVKPPSVVVSELLDLLDECYDPPAPYESMTQRVVVEHPLQAFSPRNFGADDDPRLFSYAHELVDGADALRATTQDNSSFLSGLLPMDESEREVIRLEDLIAFYQLPAKALLRRRIGLSLFEEDRTFDDREPIEPEGLEKYAISAAVLDMRRTGVETGAILDALRASGDLPLGTPGAVLFEVIDEEVRAFLDRAAPDLARVGEPRPISVHAGDARVVGVLDAVMEDQGRPIGVFFMRYATHKPKYELSAWIQHLVAQLAWPASIQGSRIITKKRGKGGAAVPAVFHLNRARNAEAALATLIDMYRFGMRQPLLFFPQSSGEFVSALAKKDRNPSSRAATKWKKAFQGPPGDQEDPYVRRLFGDASPYEPEFRWPDPETPDGYRFAEVARAVFEPIRECLSEESA